MIVYPLDFARTRLANQAKSGQSGEYGGLLDCMRKTYRSDGFEGLYRGFTVSCMCMVIYRGFYFGIYDSVKPILPVDMRDNMGVNFALGWAVTVGSGLASYPIDTIRRRMMMTSGEAEKFTGSIDCARKILAKEGMG